MTKLEPGTFIGPFELRRRAAHGASAEVWEAVHRADQRRVALKLLDIEALDDAEPWRQRFEQEAHTARRLQHPDIVAFVDAGRDGLWHWLAYEWLHGHDLSAWMTPATRPSARQALRIAERLARALAHAHLLGIIHRDVKPANVHIHPAADQIKLIDFGVARSDDGSRTRTGLLLGTPAYMAPEVLLGGDASPASDLYALAVLLFELLCGRRPYEAPSLGQLLRMMATTAAADLRSHRPDLTEACAQTLAVALQRDPAARHPDGQALADALARAAQSLPPP